MSCNELVRMEMESFLQALESYPECFAANPQITFEEHRSSLVGPVVAIEQRTVPREKRTRSAAAASSS
jgi:hypothetical protein